MSAVIWFGIVAVWAFVLIPTWVRRSDIHWRRSEDASTTRDKLGHAARVISRSGSRRFSTARTTARTTVPTMRRPAAGTRRVPVAASGSRRSVSTEDLDPSVLEAQTETLPAVHVDEPPTQQMPIVGRASWTAQTGSTTAVLDDEDPTAAAPTTTENASSAQAADAAETEAPMPTARSPRPAPRRSAPAGKPVPPHVQRARRLVWIGATALATLLLAVIFGGWWIVLNLLADAALVAYLRHLRGIAKQQLARKARTQTARADGRATAGARSPQRAARPQARPAAPRHRAESPARRPETVSVAESTAPVEAPQVIDLTDEALSDDCPTTELTVARAV